MLCGGKFGATLLHKKMPIGRPFGSITDAVKTRNVLESCVLPHGPMLCRYRPLLHTHSYYRS